VVRLRRLGSVARRSARDPLAGTAIEMRVVKVEDKIEIDALGFWVVRDGLPSKQIAWESILSIQAFKQDLVTVDLLCLLFDLEGVSILVHEDQAGWLELVNVLPTKLAGFPPFAEWFGSVALPAFAENRLKLFARRS
jgi:hypothetical protein